MDLGDKIKEYNPAFFVGRGCLDPRTDYQNLDPSQPIPSVILRLLTMLLSALRNQHGVSRNAGIRGFLRRIGCYDPLAPAGAFGSPQYGYDQQQAMITAVHMLQMAMVLTGGNREVPIYRDPETGQVYKAPLAQLLWQEKLDVSDYGGPYASGEVLIQGLGLRKAFEVLQQHQCSPTVAGLFKLYQLEEYKRAREEIALHSLLNAARKNKISNIQKLFGHPSKRWRDEQELTPKIQSLVSGEQLTIVELLMQLLNIGPEGDPSSPLRINDGEWGNHRERWHPRYRPGVALQGVDPVFGDLWERLTDKGKEMADQVLKDVPEYYGGPKHDVTLIPRKIRVFTESSTSGDIFTAAEDTVWSELGYAQLEVYVQKWKFLTQVLYCCDAEFANILSYIHGGIGARSGSLQERLTRRMFTRAVSFLLGPKFLLDCAIRNSLPDSHELNQDNPVDRGKAKAVGKISAAAGISLAFTSFMGSPLSKFFAHTNKLCRIGFSMAGGAMAVGVKALSQMAGGIKENTFAFQLIWAPAGTALGLALAVLALEGGWFTEYFDPLDGLYANGQPISGCPYDPETRDARQYEFQTQWLASWAWAWILSFLSWFTDYLELSFFDFGMEMVNCIIGGLQAGCAGIFQEALMQVAMNPGEEHRLENGTIPPQWNYDAIISEEWGVPSFNIDFEHIFTILRHLFCYPTYQEIVYARDHNGLYPDGQPMPPQYWNDAAEEGLPPVEPYLGARLCGFGWHWWDDGTPGALIWEGVGPYPGVSDMIMWSLGALVSGLFMAEGGGFLTSLTSVIGSVVANQIAAFTIQLFIKGAADLIILDCIYSTPHPSTQTDSPADPGNPTDESRYTRAL